MKKGFAFYEKETGNRVELSYYGRLKELSEFAALPDEEIKSGGYIVDTLEAAIWSLLNTDSFAAFRLMMRCGQQKNPMWIRLLFWKKRKRIMPGLRRRQRKHNVSGKRQRRQRVERHLPGEFDKMRLTFPRFSVTMMPK